MTFQSELRAWLLTVAGIATLGAIAFRVMTAPPIPDLAPVVAKANHTLDLINAPCSPGPCGPIENVSKLTTKIGDVAVVAQIQAQQSGKLVNAASQSLEGVSAEARADLTTLNTQESQIGPLLASLKASSDSIPPAIAAVQATAQQGTIDLASLNDLLKSKAVNQTISGLGETAQNTGKITGDLYAFENRYLNPPPCKTRGCEWKRVWAGAGPVFGVGNEAVHLYEAFHGYKVNVESLP